MKPAIKTLLILMALVLTPLGCERNHEALEIQCLNSVFGGCNSVTAWPTEENNTVIITQTPDTLDVFISFNYNGGGPFSTDCIVHDDSIIMTIQDTCTILPCASRSYCDYLFNFYFAYKGSSDKPCYWKLILFQAISDQNILIKEGSVDICGE